MFVLLSPLFLSYRTTILPSEGDLEKMLDHFADFHISFTKEHS